MLAGIMDHHHSGSGRILMGASQFPGVLQFAQRCLFGAVSLKSGA